MIQEDPDFLIEDLVIAGADGTPVVVFVEDYRERQDLASALAEKASSFGVEVECLQGFEQTSKQLPHLQSGRNQAAILLVDAGEADAFGPWLDAIREALPQLVRFLIVLVFRPDFPLLAKKSPAFTSWAKITEIERLAISGSCGGAENLDAETNEIKKTFGMSPNEYIDAWKRGEIPDTHRNSAWLNLAYAAVSNREAK